MKRYFALLFIIFTLTMNTTVSAKTFVDMNTVPWQGAQSYIYQAVELGIMNGDSKTQKFRPRDNVTYCELVQTMYNVLKKTDYLYTYLEPEEVIERWRTTLEYYNIPKWAYESVSYALEHNIVSITDVSRFMKDTKQQHASRESTAVVFGKSMIAAYDVDINVYLPYYDSNQISNTSVPYVGLLKDLGVMKGRSEHMFYPKQQINRAELAVLSCNAYDALMEEQTINEDDMIAWLFEQGLIEWLTPQDDLSNWTVITSEEEDTFFEDIDNERPQTSNRNQNHETEKSQFNRNNYDYCDDDRQDDYNDRYDNNRQDDYNDRYDNNRRDDYNDRYDDDKQDNYNNRYDDDGHDDYNDRYDDDRQDDYNDRYEDNRQDDYNGRYDDNRQDDYNDRYDDNRQDDYNDRYDDDKQDNYDNRYDDDRQDDYNDRYEDNRQDDYNDRYDDDDKQDDYNDRYDDDDKQDDYNDRYDDEPEEEFRQDETGDIYVVTK